MSAIPFERALVECAREYAARVAGLPLVSLVLVLGDGGKRRIDCPACSLPPPETGWKFTPAGALHDGRHLRVGGKQLAVLRLLADASEPMALEEIREKAWDKYTAEATVVNCISKLRATLREQLAMPPDRDPIDATEDGYFLTVG